MGRGALVAGLAGVVLLGAALGLAVGVTTTGTAPDERPAGEEPAAADAPAADVPADTGTGSVAELQRLAADGDEVPSCRREGCLTWTAGLPDEEGPWTLLTDGELVVTSSAGRLEARTVADGRVRWTAGDAADPVPASQVVRAGDALLHVDVEGRLVARDLADGRVRWRTDALGQRGRITSARDGGDGTVAVSVTDGAASGPPAVARLAADTGEVAWSRDLRTPTRLADDTIVGFAEQDLVALDPSGEERWRATDVVVERVGGSIEATGPVLELGVGGPDPVRHLRWVADGQRLDVRGHPLPLGSPDVALVVDADREELHLVTSSAPEPSWTVTSTDELCDGHLEAGDVHLLTCAGERVVRDGADGAERSRAPGPPTASALAGRTLGTLTLVPRARLEDGGATGWALLGPRDADEVARFPAATAATVADAQVVLRGESWMVAVPLP